MKTKQLNSHWPKCNAIDRTGPHERIYRTPSPCEAPQAKRHHIRTAAIRALVVLKAPLSVEPTRELLADASYETRMEVKAAVKALTGEDVLTVRGE